MMKFKQSIIYTLIFALISGSFGFSQSALAQDSTQQGPTPLSNHISVGNQIARENLLPEMTIERIDKAAANLAESTGEFSESQVAKDGITQDAADSPKMTTDEAKQNWISKIYDNNKNQMWSIFRSWISAKVLFGIAEANKKAHDRNLQLTPENERRLTDELGDPFALKSALVYIPSAVAGGAVNFGLLKLWLGFRKIVLHSEGTGILFNYLLSGAESSIGNQYTQGFILSASEEVLEHPDLFGGLTAEERGALKLLEYRVNMSYFLTALANHSTWVSKDPNEIHSIHVFHTIAVKIEMAMNLILIHDSNLREALWSHLWSQAFLQGNNGIALASQWVSEWLTIKLIDKDEGFWKKNWKSLWLSIATGFTTNLLPNVAKDWGTAVFNSRYAEGQGVQAHGMLWWRLKSGEGETLNGRKYIVEDFIKNEEASRESRLSKYVYLMKLAIDNLNTLDVEKNQIAFFKTSEGKAQLPQALNWRDKIALKFRECLGFDCLPEGWRDKLDSFYANRYEVIFGKSANKILDIYKEDNDIFKKLSQIDIPQETQIKLRDEQRKLAVIEDFLNRQADNLSERWAPHKAPSAQFDISRQLWERLSLFGVHENKILQQLYEP